MMTVIACLIALAVLVLAETVQAETWQPVRSGEKSTVSFDKDLTVDGRLVRTRVMERFSLPTRYSNRGDLMDTQILDIVIDCDDLSSTFKRRTLYLHARQVLDEAVNYAMPPVPAGAYREAYTAACAQR